MDNQKQEDRRNLTFGKEQGEADFERLITYLSAGGLALSFTFIEDLVPLATAKWKWLLITGWASLGCTLLLNLWSHVISTNFHENSIKEFDELDQDSETEKVEYDTKLVSRNSIISKINLLTTLLLSIGVLLLVLFTSINVLNMSNDKESKEGATSVQIEKLGRTITKPSSVVSKGSSDSKSNNSNGKEK